MRPGPPQCVMHSPNPGCDDDPLFVAALKSCPVKVSQAFLDDFAYLASRYRWTPADAEEMKAAIRANPDVGRRYITTLAAAHRAGYEQTPENGFMRLAAWCAAQGWPDPCAEISAQISAHPEECFPFANQGGESDSGATKQLISAQISAHSATPISARTPSSGGRV